MELHRLSLLGTVVVVTAASGCGGGSGAGSSETEASQTTTAAAAQAPIKTVTISEKEFSLTPSSVSLAKPGTYAFKAVNDGSIAHALEIEGNGVEQKTNEIQPGESATLTVDLKSNGSYEMYCPVDGHKNQGMKGAVTVGSSSSGGTGTTPETTTTTSTNSRYGY